MTLISDAAILTLHMVLTVPLQKIRNSEVKNLWKDKIKCTKHINIANNDNSRCQNHFLMAKLHEVRNNKLINIANNG